MLLTLKNDLIPHINRINEAAPKSKFPLLSQSFVRAGEKPTGKVHHFELKKNILHGGNDWCILFDFDGRKSFFRQKSMQLLNDQISPFGQEC